MPPVLTAETLHMIAKDVPRMGWSADDARIPLLFKLVELQTPKLSSAYNQGLCYICAFALANWRELERRYLQSSSSSSFTSEEDDRILVVCAQVIDQLLFTHRLCLLLDPKSCFLQQYVDNFDSLFCSYLPQCYHAFQLCQFDTVFFTLDWFTTFFTNALEHANCLLVWDLVLDLGVGDGFYIAGLAVLSVVYHTHLLPSSTNGSSSSSSSDELFLNFKQWTRTGVPRDALQAQIELFSSVLIPHAFARSHSTIRMLERRVSDPNDMLVQLPFDATFFMRAIQAGDSTRVRLELTKYRFPGALLEYAVYRAGLLGHSVCVEVLLGAYVKEEDAALFAAADLPMLLECCALLAQGEVCRLLLGSFPELAGGGGDGGAALQHVVRRVQEVERQFKLPAEVYVHVLAVLMSGSSEKAKAPSAPASPSGAASPPLPSSSSTSVCTDCEAPLTPHNRVMCSRCKLAFCDKQCCNTFRQIAGKRFRTCNSCLHYWGTTTTIPASSSLSLPPPHFPSDLLVDDATGRTRACCECDKCLQTLCKFRARHRLLQQRFRNFVFQVEDIAQAALDAKTQQLRVVLLK